MPFEPGHKKSGGRPKGSRNKNSIPLLEKSKELGIDPFEILLYFSKNDWKSLGYKSNIITVDQRLRAASDACQYLYPKLKAIDHKTSEPESMNHTVILQWADDANHSQNEASDASTENNQ